MKTVAKLAALVIPAALLSIPASAATCESLASVALPNATITSAQMVAAGKLVVPPPPANVAPFGGPTPKVDDLPAFCRVTATLTPSKDSDIKIEVWLPSASWNGKYQAVGNGGWAGVISYGALAEGLKRGYATSSTDTGHTGATGSFALGITATTQLAANQTEALFGTSSIRTAPASGGGVIMRSGPHWVC